MPRSKRICWPFCLLMLSEQIMVTRVLDGGTYTVGNAAASGTLYRRPLPVRRSIDLNMLGFTIFNNDYYLHLITRTRLAKRFALSHVECRSNVLAHRNSRGRDDGRQRRHVTRSSKLQAPSLRTSDARVTVATER